MVRVALTGGIACGKSLSALILGEMGCDVVEADDIARDCMRPGTAVYRDIKRCFGGKVISESGEIDRKGLGRLVMNDQKLRGQLNAIVHPGVIDKWQRWLAERENKKGLAVVVVPLLYEAGQGDGWDAVICLCSERSLQVSRLAERGIPPGEAVKWLAAQMRLEEKVKRADFVVCNNGSENILRKQIECIVKAIAEK